MSGLISVSDEGHIEATTTPVGVCGNAILTPAIGDSQKRFLTIYKLQRVFSGFWKTIRRIGLRTVEGIRGRISKV